MAAVVKSVAVIGGHGNVGWEVVVALIAGGYDVTVLTRPSSKANYPNVVVVKPVEISSVSAVADALQGIDAVVSAIGTLAVDKQRLVIDAAIQAKVRRFVPSEFGVNTRAVGTDGLGALLQGKVRVVDYLMEKSKEHDWFSWTAFSTGLFFDWGLTHGSFGLDRPNKIAQIHDSGDERVPVSNLSFVGRAVAVSLNPTNLPKTADRYLNIASFNISQNELLALVETVQAERDGPSTPKWTRRQDRTADLQKVGLDAVSQGKFGEAFLPLLIAHLFADGAGKATEGDKNDAVSVLGLQEEDSEEGVRRWLRN